MNSSSWLKGARSAVVTHRSPDANNETSIDQSIADLKGSADRVERLSKASGIDNIRRSVAFLGAGVMLASSPVNAAATESVTQDAINYGQKHLQAMMSPASQALHKAAGAENLTIVSQDDPKLNEFVAHLDPTLLPDVRPPEMPDKGPEHDSEVKRSLLSMYFEDRVDKAHAAFTGTHHDDERVCFVQDSVPKQIPSDYGLPLVIGDKEMSLGVLSHELAHCQDFNEVAVKDEHGHVIDEGRQREIVADLTASLLVSSHTGNWDFMDYSLKPMREINVDHTDHATTHWLDRVRYTTDLEKLEPLSQKEAFELAQHKYERINYSLVQDRNLDDWVLNKGYKKALEKDLSWEKMPENFREYYSTEHGVNSQAELMPKLEAHGKSQIGTYLNHVNYKSLEGDEKTVTELFKYLDKHGSSFDNQKLLAEVANQRLVYQEQGQIQVLPLSHAADVLIDQKAKHRYEANAQKMAEIEQSFYPSGPSKHQELSTIEPFSEVQNETEHSNAKERFKDKIKLAEKEHDHSNDSEHEQPG